MRDGGVAGGEEVKTGFLGGKADVLLVPSTVRMIGTLAIFKAIFFCCFFLQSKLN